MATSSLHVVTLRDVVLSGRCIVGVFEVYQGPDMRLIDSNIFWVNLQKIGTHIKKAAKAQEALEDSALSTMVTAAGIGLVVTGSGLVGPISPETTDKLVSWFAQGIIYAKFGMVLVNYLKYDRARRTIKSLLK
jgi:hypothetical protein